MTVSRRKIGRPKVQPPVEPVPATIIGGYGSWVGSANDADNSMTALSAEMGREVLHGHFFFDHRWGWPPIANNTIQLDAWAAWIDGKEGRDVSISVPLLIGSTDGGTDVAAEMGDLAGLAAGNYDHHFASLGTSLASRPQFSQVILRLGWEFNGYAWPWSPTQDKTSGSLAQAIENYKTGFARVAKAIKTECPGARIIWCPSLGFDALPGYTLEELYAGDESIDYVGFGAYDYNLNVTNYTQDNVGRLKRWDDNWSKPNGFADMIALANAHQKRLVHIEWGLWPQNFQSQQGGGDDAIFMQKLSEYFVDHNVYLSVYNNSIPEHQLQSYPSAKAAYQQHISTL